MPSPYAAYAVDPSAEVHGIDAWIPSLLPAAPVAMDEWTATSILDDVTICGDLTPHFDGLWGVQGGALRFLSHRLRDELLAKNDFAGIDRSVAP